MFKAEYCPYCGSETNLVESSEVYGTGESSGLRVMEYTSLIDRRLAIKLQLDKLKQELEEIDAELKDQFEPGEILLGSDGYGYEIKTQQKVVYGEHAIRLLKSRNLLEPFVSISTAKLQELAKKGRLPWSDIDLLKSTANIQETKMIVQYIPQEAKIL